MRSNTRGKVGAISLSLALAISGIGMTVAPTTAIAETGTITITSQANADATYDAYLIFKADVTADAESGDTLSHIEWALGEDAQAEIVNFLLQQGYGDWLTNQGLENTTEQQYNAQNAYEYIASGISGSTGTNTPTWVNSGTFASDLAELIVGSEGNSKTATVASGAAYTGDEGYYLFVTSSDTLSDGDVATSPIFTAIGGSISSVTEKATSPTLTKQVQEDSTSTYQSYADAEIGQDVSYKITGTIAGNYNTFSEYYLGFTDVLSEGLAMDGVSSVKVYADGTDVTSDFTVNYDSATNTLTVVCEDTKDIEEVKAGSVIVVEYTAYLTGDAIVYGADGNPNTVTMEFSNDPYGTSKGELTSRANLYSFLVSVDKTDNATGAVLEGATFVIRNSEGCYLTSDGTWTAEDQDGAATFVTDENGQITDIEGLDEGTYTLVETVAPDGYTIVGNGEITIVVESEYDENGNLTGLSATVDAASINGTAVAEVGSASADDGEINVDVVNDRNVSLALTGGVGVGVAGVTIVAIGLGWYLKRRHDDVNAPIEG